MRSYGIVEDKVISQFSLKEGVIVNNIEMIIKKLFFYGSVIAFYTAVYLWAPGISKVVGNTLCFEVFIEVSPELRAIVCLNGFNVQGIDLL